MVSEMLRPEAPKSASLCVPKMDHHCPWTCNCVSHFTFPHFVRFLFYAVVSIVYLESFIFTRIGIIWDQRTLPSYLGPSIPALAHLFVLVVTNSLTLFALGILLIRTLWSLGANITTIESWEIERHSTLVRRARYFGGQLDGPDGVKITIRKQEFPYDIGIFKNIRDGMGGSSNILSWFWPFAATPDRNSGVVFEVNGFEDPNLSWPPPDPDRIPRKLHNADTGPFTIPRFSSASDEIEAFRQRQEEDIARRGRDDTTTIRRRKKFHERHETRRRAGQNEIVGDEEEEEDRLEDDDEDNNSDAYDYVEVDEGEEAWRDSDGQRLGDYGVDEDVEFYDEDDVPLSVVRERIKAGI
ncbi:Palmitoyltransferase pfa4 [Talaromyces islandicus]|uniref:Palmitoyltransferase n=1 Tax=Talaromyces islandicus TaxID=28573 RepID=A0A0U1M7X2_TALIS|nr:Palmitoyltransferase pfa4 [Talaromyces islandicus]